MYTKNIGHIYRHRRRRMNTIQGCLNQNKQENNDDLSQLAYGVRTAHQINQHFSIYTLNISISGT